MKITCSKCFAEYNLPPEKIPTTKKNATCTKCGSQMIIDPASSTKSDTDKSILIQFPELTVPAYSKCNLTEILAPNKKGGYKTGRNRFKVKILKAVGHLLNKVLVQDEQVLRVAQGVAYYPAEILFGNGILTMMSNYYAILVTNRRLVFININSRTTKPTNYIMQLPYANIKKASFGTIFSRMILKSVTGKNRTFTYMKRYLVKELKEFILNKITTVKTTSKGEVQPENICPACFLPTAAVNNTCPYCEAKFKTPLGGFVRSLILPGWGDIYLGHKGLGTFELLGSFVVWGVVIVLVAGSLKSGQNADLTANLIIAAVVLLFYNVSDAIFTYFMGKKGYILLKK